MTLIMGTPQTGNTETIIKHILSRNPAIAIKCSIEEWVEFYFLEGAYEDVRGDIAIFQALKETGYLKYGGLVQPAQNNYCGLGATGPGFPGASFATPRLGVRAHIQHLKAYASKAPLEGVLADPRFFHVSRGIAPHWQDLNGRWAVPGVGYGEQIVSMFDANAGQASKIDPAALDNYLADISMTVSNIRRWFSI